MTERKRRWKTNVRESEQNTNKQQTNQSLGEAKRRRTKSRRSISGDGKQKGTTMKVNIKGLVFTGFAAAILSANAMATGENVVTSKSYTDATYQFKSIEPSIGGKNGVWTPLDTTVPTENASESAAPTTAAVRAAINSASQPGNFIDTQVNSSVTNKAPSDQAVYNYVGRGTLTVDINGTQSATFNANAASDTTISFTNIEVTTNKLAQGEASGSVLDSTDTNVDDTHYPTAKAVSKAIAAVNSARTYVGGSNISIDSENNISADTGAITDTATTLVDGATVYAALANEQDKNITDKYEVNKNGVWTDIGSAVSGSGNVTVTADPSTGALTIGATTDTAATESSTHLITSGAVYDAIQDATGGTVIPTMDTRVCDSTHPCALVNDSTGLHWRTMATATDTTGGACGDVGGCTGNVEP